MAIKVAVASEDGETVHQHFGRASRFVIYEVDGDRYRRIEVRNNAPACGSAPDDDGAPHGGDPMARSVDLVSDCRAVLVARIGAGAVGRRSNLGVHAVVAPDYIDSALRRLISSGLLGAPARPGESDFQWLDPL